MNYLNIVIAAIALFCIGIAVSRVGGIGGIFVKLFRWIRGYRK